MNYSRLHIYCITIAYPDYFLPLFLLQVKKNITFIYEYNMQVTT